MRILLFFILSFQFIAASFAQPGNDDCVNAFPIPLYVSEKLMVPIGAYTNAATQSTVPEAACSQIWISDDVWFKIQTPDSILPYGFTAKTWFDYYNDTTDIKAVGMAFYASCDTFSELLRCFNSSDPKENSITLISPCLEANQTYFIHVWSSGNTKASEGNFRIGAYVNVPDVKPLWHETFDQGLEHHGWTTWGTCEQPDSNINAGWKYHADGVFDQGLYSPKGFGINSPSLCDGAVGVDSDYNNTSGFEEQWGEQPCSFPSVHYLLSPVLYTRDWNAAGISITWHQAIRQFQSHHFVGYRWRDSLSAWSDWDEFEINQEFPINGDFVTDNYQKHLLPLAAHHDSLQVRFRYEDKYYFWIIDDVALIPTEVNNLTINQEHFAIPPWAQIPADQVEDYFALTNIENIGVDNQHDVQLTHQVKDLSHNEVIVEQNLHLDLIPAQTQHPDTLFFPTAVHIPRVPAEYEGTYSVFQFEPDYDTLNNSLKYQFKVGGSTFAYEDGPTGVYNSQDIPFIKYNAWTYGNVFYPVRDVAAEGITFGIVPKQLVAGDSIHLNLLEWKDENGDQVAQAIERKLVGQATYYFKPDEDDWIVTTLPLINVNDPGSQVIMEGGKIYFAMMEYLAEDGFGGARILMLVCGKRDYRPTIAAYDSAYVHGLMDRRRYMSVFGYAPDCIIEAATYSLKQNTNVLLSHPGDQIVPMVRVETGEITATAFISQDYEITISPNPTKDFIRISWGQHVLPFDSHLGLYDMMGRLIQTISVGNGQSVILRDLEEGMYLLAGSLGGKRYIRKVMVVK